MSTQRKCPLIVDWRTALVLFAIYNSVVALAIYAIERLVL